MSSTAAPKTLQSDWSLETIWEEHTFTHARLHCDPITRHLAAGPGAMLERINVVEGEQRACWKAEINAEAVVRYHNGQTDLLTGRLVKQLRFAHGGPGNSAFDIFFPTETPSRVIRKGLEEQLKDMEQWPKTLASSTDATLQAFGPQVAQALVDGEAALAARGTAEGDTKRHRLNHIEPLVADINKQRDDLFAKLLEIATAQGLDRAWARTFFK